jgi:hypothetical protein
MRKLLLLAAVMLFVVPSVFGQDTGTISGTVQTEADGVLVPLPRAHVAAFPLNGDRPAGGGMTDSLGHYTFAVPYGDYHVRAEKFNFLPEWYDNVERRENATSVHVDADTNPTGIDFILVHEGPPPPPPPEGGFIGGRIFEIGNNHGIAFAMVRLVRVIGEPLTLETYSLWGGGYAFPHLPPGGYTVSATKDGFAPGVFPETLNVDNNEFNHIDMGLQRLDPPGGNGSIAGVVTDGATDLPVGGVRVIAFSGNWRSFDAMTDSTGAYLIDDVPAGTYHVVAHKWGYWPGEYPDPVVVDSLDITGIDIVLAPFEETGISGIVTDAVTGLPIAHASVFATNVDHHFIRFMARTGEDGTYFMHTAPGEYVVEACALGYWRQEYPTHVSVVEGDVTEGINFALATINYGSIAGMVSDSTGNPISRAYVEARRLGGHNAMHTVTDSTGAYSLDNVMPGAYRVIAFHRNFGPGAYPDSVIVAEGQDVTGINIVLGAPLPPLDGSITGLVTDDSTGAGINHAIVMVIGQVERWGRRHPMVRYTFTDSTGHYAFDNLPVIPLKIFAGARGYLGEFYDNVRRYSEATPVTPDADNINLALTPRMEGLRSIVGRVIMPSGYETEGIVVYAMVDGEIADIVAADPQGYYALDELEAGMYDISVSSFYGDAELDNTVDAVYNDVYDADVLFSVTSVDDEQPLPAATSLAQNYPNPFNARTLISFNLAEAGKVTLSVYNIVGQKVASLVDGQYQAGSYSVTWDGADASGKTVASGVYYYRLETNGRAETMKMTMLK